MTPTPWTRNLLRLAVIAGVAAAVLGIGPARGQPGTTPTMPVVRQTVTVPAADPPAPAGRGLATEGSGTQTQSHAGLPTVNATTHACAGSPRNESKLGLMEHTAMYSHCDYP
jgi:hypothetical protein